MKKKWLKNSHQSQSVQNGNKQFEKLVHHTAVLIYQRAYACFHVQIGIYQFRCEVGPNLTPPHIHKFENSVDWCCSLVKREKCLIIAVRRDRQRGSGLDSHIRCCDMAKMYFTLQYTSTNPWLNCC